MKSYFEIEEEFVRFFMNKQYTKYDAIPITSKDDSTFFTIAGMKQFIDLFLQKKQPIHTKVVNCQPCIRLTDLHNNTSRHTSMFLMLGLFRFDEGFNKQEIVQSIYDFYKHMGIDMNRIYITTHADKPEDFQMACQVNNNRVIPMEDNFWSMGTYGPCGSCVEFYYNYTDITDLTEVKNLIINDGKILEIGNIVFIDQTKTPNGLQSLGRTFVDTGLGLSRISQIINNKSSVYDTDISALKPYIINKEYENPIIDALITSCFIMKEQVAPGAEGKHYILRKILRKALFYERNINIIPILNELYKIFNDFEFMNKQEFIRNQIQQEKQLLEKIIEKSSKILNTCQNAADYAAANHTHGVPMELIEIQVNHNEKMIKSIEEELAAHRQISMKHSNIIEFKIPTNACFYEKTTCTTEVLYVEEKEDCTLVVTKDSCFYPTSGGQQGDKGTISNDQQSFKILETTKQNISFDEIVIIHKCEKNPLKVNDKVTLQVDEESRKSNARAHTALHIFAEAIMRDLPADQVGSYVCADYARIDLNKTIPAEERTKFLQKYADKANECIKKAIPVVVEHIDKSHLDNNTLYDAHTPYGDIVRRITIKGYSNQLCGGTHVSNTADIKQITPIKISSIGAGKIRIEILCGDRYK